MEKTSNLYYAAEHTRRAIIDGGNAKEWARAKDEMLTVGKGLHTSEKKYQKKYEESSKAKDKHANESIDKNANISTDKTSEKK